MSEDEPISDEEQIDALFAKAKQLEDELEAAIKNKDMRAQGLLAIKLMQVQLGFKRIETRKRLALAFIMRGVREAKTPEEKRKNLLSAFGITACIRGLAKYELVDDDLTDAAETQLHALISGLDELEPEGRKALAPILDSFNLDERVCAAVALLELMPDRAMAILRDLLKNAPGTNASLTARAALNELNKTR